MSSLSTSDDFSSSSALVRRFTNGTPSNAYPCALGIASAWDDKHAAEIGHYLADEAKAKNVHVVLGPTLNMQRSPLGGRGFEAFSEDPVLCGQVAGAYVKGMQANGAAATPKHFVCNDQEFERQSSDSKCLVESPGPSPAINSERGFQVSSRCAPSAKSTSSPSESCKRLGTLEPT